jgi:hypothetical protein
MTASFDYVQFINDGFDAQQKYASKIVEMGPNDLVAIDKMAELGLPRHDDGLSFRYQKMIEHFGHMTEEMIEARVYVPRRSWKNGERSFMDNAELRKEFIAEMYDILLFHRAILAYGGVTGEEFAQIAAEKQAYNQVRPDHNVNGTAVVTASPSEELSGQCESASFSGTPNNTYDRE